MSGISATNLSSQNPTSGLSDAALTHTVERGESLSQIAKDNGMSLDQVLALNPQVKNPDLIYPGDHIALGKGASTYTVQSGDSISAIATQLGISPAALLNANPQVVNANMIYVGDKLNIPAGASSSPAQGSPAQGTPATGAPATGSPAAGSPAPSTVSGAPGSFGDQNPLGKLIFRGESQGAGGYNAYNTGRAGDSSRPRDLTSMTLGQVMKAQANGELFAVGKYQVIPATMKEAVANLKLNPNDKFDASMQEKIFNDFLIDEKRPQIRDYVTGETSGTSGLQKAQLAVAQEFASVASPYTGKSYYDGDSGGNHSSITAGECGTALNQMRTQYQDNIKQGMSPDQAWRAISGGSAAAPAATPKAPTNTGTPSAAPATAAPAPVTSTAQPASRLDVSDRGVALVKHYEGFFPKPYNDPVGHATVGYGHLLHRGNVTGADRQKWGTLTEKQATDLLKKDLSQARDDVRAAVKVPVTQGQFDALVSFQFNTGGLSKGEAGCTLLRKLNSGDYSGAQKEFGKWVKADGQTLAGLVRRRKEEADMFGSAAPAPGRGTPAPAPSTGTPTTGTPTAGTPATGTPTGNGGAVATAGGKIPDTKNMTQAQKYDLYANYVGNFGNAQAKSDLAAGQRVIVGLRHDTNSGANRGNGVYDDRIVVMWKDSSGKHVQEFKGNTEGSAQYDPKSQYFRKAGGDSDANGDGVYDLPRLADGTYGFRKDYWSKGGQVQTGGNNILSGTTNQRVQRDSNHDGVWDSRDPGRNALGGQDFGIYFHRGGDNNTYSSGCQTLAQGDFNKFWTSLGGQSNFTYTMINEARLPATGR
jgi:GH24 family phage-related lysozyme (muramidase)/LysM repeat protein